MKAITRRSFLAGVASAATVAGLAACSNGSGSKAASDGARKGKVYWLNFKPELDATAQSLAKKYMEKYPDVKVKVVTAASGTYEQTLTSEMDKDDAPTLFVIGNRAAVKEWGSYAMDLKDTELVKAQNTDEYNLKDGNKVVAAGYCYECYGICVNDELLEKAGHSKDDIKDFASLKKVVEDIHSRASELGFDAFAATDLDGASAWRVTGHLANLEYFYEEKKAGSTWTECPKTITGEYLPNYKNLFDLAINNSTVAPETLATGGHDPETEFAQGKAAFIFSGSFGYADIKDRQEDLLHPLLLRRAGRGEGGPQLRHRELLGRQRQRLRGGQEGHARLRALARDRRRGRQGHGRRPGRPALHRRPRGNQPLPQQRRGPRLQGQLHDGLGHELPAQRRHLPRRARLRAQLLHR